MDLIAEFKAKARKDLKRIVLPEGDDDRILPAAKKIVEEGVARPIVLGPEEKITEEARKLGLDASKVKLIDPATSPDLGR